MVAASNRVCYSALDIVPSTPSSRAAKTRFPTAGSLIARGTTPHSFLRARRSTPLAMASTRMHTYHCMCIQLALATCGPLQEIPTRNRDGAAICPVSRSTAPLTGSVVLASSTHVEDAAVVLKLDDGFEKRYAVRCGRCDLQIGYMLDRASFEDGSRGRKDDVVYLLPGGLMSTEEMSGGKDMSKEAELVGAAG